MKKLLSNIQLTLGAICASSLAWYLISTVFGFFNMEIHPLWITLVSFILLLILSLTMYYKGKKWQ